MWNSNFSAHEVYWSSAKLTHLCAACGRGAEELKGTAWPARARNIDYLALFRKSLPVPAIGHT